MTKLEPAETVRSRVPTRSFGDQVRSVRGALPSGPWWRLLLIVAGLLVAAQMLGAQGLLRDLDAPTRVASYERKGYEVNVKAPAAATETSAGSPTQVLVSRKKKGETVQRDLGAHLHAGEAAGLIAKPIAAAIIIFLLLQLGSWVDAGRPRVPAAVRWDKALPVLWLLPVGISVIVLSRLAVDVPAAATARFPSALMWPDRQANAALLAALTIPLAAMAAGVAERFDWGQRILRRPLIPAVVRRWPEIEARLPLRIYDLLLVAACGLFIVTGLLGRAAFGATLSLSVGGAAVQVVEAAKVLLVLHAAFFLADHEHDNGPGDTAIRLGLHDPRVAKAAASMLLAGGTAVVATGDLGTGLLAAAIPLLAGVAATGSVALLGGAAAGGFAALGLVLLSHRPAYVYSRVAALLSPFERSETLTGVRWALAEGGFLGTGLGSGRPHAVPNVDSDFILAAIGEELGLAGITLVLLATGALVHRGLLIAAREEEPLRKHLATAATLAIFAQAAVITAGTLGLIPATGVPYPLVSRGGASLVVHSAMIGVLAQISAGRVPQAGETLRDYPGWKTVLVRLRATSALALSTLFVCWSAAAWFMVGRPAEDRDRAFVDTDKVALVEHLVSEGALAVDGGLVRPRLSKLPAAAESLRPELRRRVSTKRSTVDGRSLDSLARSLRVADGQVSVDGSSFSIRNPRRRAERPFRILDRAGRTLAGTKNGKRVHPHGEATFPVVGHRTPGSASFLEEDAASALDALLQRDAALHPARVRARTLRLFEGELRAERPRGPWTVVSTIDRAAQRNAMNALSGKRGAAVAVDLETGGILVLASRPSIDPDALIASGGLDAAFRDADLELRAHRALRRRYPPGSTMKLVTAAAAAEEAIGRGAVKVGSAVLSSGDAHCRGSDGTLSVKDAGGARHGRLELTDAVAKSCNIFFARTGVALGPQVREMGVRMGFGEARSLVPWAPDAELTARPSHLLTCRAVAGSGPLPKGCDAAAGPEGLVPVSDQWIEANPRLMARAAFGQTVVETTPLQMLEVTATIAGGGVVPVFRLLERVEGRCGEVACPLAVAGSQRDRVLKAKVAATVRDGMTEGYRRGTSSPSNLRLRLGRSGDRYTLERRPAQPVAVAAKTGTAEVQDKADHSWFVAFAPAGDPEVAVVVLVEHGGAGVATAGPIAMRVLRDALNARR